MLLKILRGTAIVLALISTTFEVKAQTSTNFDLAAPTKVYAPSDNAASLVQVKDLPVSFYTGTPQVSFELFTVKSGNLSHGISINHSGRAVMVEEESGPLGLSWSLNAGGILLRSITGANDEKGSFGGYTGAAGYLGLPLYSTSNPTDWLNTLTMCEKKDLSEGRYELTPDIYNLSFDGRSAKMFFDHTGKAYFSPAKPWKVLGNTTVGFIIIVEDGTRYEFGVLENSTISTDNSASEEASVVTGKTAWYLSRIISNTLKDTIQFNYIPISWTHDQKIPGEARYNLMPGQTVNPCSGASADAEKIVTYLTTQSVSTYMLSNISYPAGKVDFVLTQDRIDTDGNTYRYREMNVYNRTSTGTFNLIRKFTFNQTYSDTATSVLKKRLLLNSFVEYGGLDSVKHTFTYITPDQLPDKNSKAQDHWGFYNGRNTNTTLIPAFTDNGSLTFSGANREPDSTKMQIGLLKTISYPTGGTVTLDYEMNEYSYLGLSSLYKPWRIDSLYRDTTFAVSTVGGTNIFKDTLVFTVPTNISSSDVSVSYRITGPNPSDPPADVYVYSSTWTQLFTAGTSNGVSVPITTMAFQPGNTYYLVVSRENSQYNAYLTVNHNYWKKYLAPSISKYAAGGTRIKRITMYDGISHTNDQTKRFVYLQNDSTSSGHLINSPKYEDIQYTPYYCQNSNGQLTKGGDWQYFTRHASSVMPATLTQGNVIGYDRVSVLHGENGENGKETYDYSMFKDDGGNGYPYTPQSSREELRGLSLAHRVYNNTGTIIKSTTNEYNYNNTPGSPNYRWVWGAKCGTKKSNNTIVNGCPDLNWEFFGGMYSVYQFWPTLKSISDTTYDMVTGAKLGVKTNYYYDSTNLQLIQEDFINSDLVNVITLYRYPNNFSGSAVYDSMIARNMINTVVEKTVTRGGGQSSKEKTNFGFFNGYIAPSSLQVVSGPGTIETRLLYHRYDNYGNLIEQGKSNDLREIYVWGYNYQYPVAKITGSNYSAVNAISLNNTVVQNPSSDNALRAEITKLRNGLIGSGAQVTSFTFSPQIGTTSETDPSGKITYYEYDLLGRLKVVKDNDGKILKTYEYKYLQPLNQ